MIIKVIDPSEDKRWDNFIYNHPEGTIFHTSNWARVIQKTYGYIPYYFILIEEADQKVAGGCPFFLIKNYLTGNRLVCLPFTDNCFPLFNQSTNIDFIFFPIVKMMKQRKLDNIEIRGEMADSLKKFNFNKHNYYKLFRLDISIGLDNLWKEFKQKSIRYPIRKAQNSGIIIEKSVSEEILKSFYRLNILTRRKHGIIPQPYKFFLHIQQEIFNRNLGFLLIARYKNIVIAGSLFFIYKNTIYYKFNASHINYLKFQPNHLILWEAIKWAVENDYKIFDLGRTSPDNPGLMALKRHWGTEEIDLPYYYWPEIRGTSATKESSLRYRIVSSVLKKTSIPLLKIAGNLFYKHLG